MTPYACPAGDDSVAESIEADALAQEWFDAITGPDAERADVRPRLEARDDRQHPRPPRRPRS
jgi:hypothetical protein